MLCAAFIPCPRLSFSNLQHVIGQSLCVPGDRPTPAVSLSHTQKSNKTKLHPLPGQHRDRKMSGNRVDFDTGTAPYRGVFTSFPSARGASQFPHAQNLPQLANVGRVALALPCLIRHDATGSCSACASSQPPKLRCGTVKDRCCIRPIGNPNRPAKTPVGD